MSFIQFKMIREFKNILFLLFVLFLNVPGRAQTWQWANKAGGVAHDVSGGVEVDDAGNSYIAGKFYDSISFGNINLSNLGLWSVFIAKYDINGSLIWAKIAAEDTAISVCDICIDNSGSITLTGRYSGSGVFGVANADTLQSVGDYDVFVARYDASGNFKWARSSGGPGSDFSGGISHDHQGNVFITGDFHITSYPASSSKIFVAKYDSLGNCPWFKMPSSYGNFHYGMGIKTDTSGNSFITGQFFNYLIFDSAHILHAGNIEANIFVAKFNSEGNVTWINRAGASTGYTGGNAIGIDEVGNSYITGYYRGNISFDTISLSGPTSISYDVFVAKCDSTGHFLWANKGSGPGGLDEARGISVDKNGNSYITGYFTDNFTLGTTVLSNSGGRDLFIAKINSTGNFIWALQCSGSMDINFSGIKGNSHGVFLAGSFADSINFGSTVTIYTNSNTNYDIFLAKIDGSNTGVDEKQPQSEVLLYPNPSFSEIQLKGIEDVEDFCISDLNGKIVMSGRTTVKKSIDIKELAAGVYFIMINRQSIGGKPRTFRFIKN